MKYAPLNFICTFALTTIFLQSIDVQSVDAQERMFGNGRFLKRVFGDLSPSSESAKAPTPAAAAKKGQLQSKQPTAAHRPSQNAQPTLANHSQRSRSAKPRSIQPRLPKSPAAADAQSIPTRSNAKATLGFGMLVQLKKERLYVSQLDPKGNAANAGVRIGDRLVAGGGIDFESLSDFNGIGDILEDGDQLEFEVERNGREKEMMIVFGKASAEQASMVEGSIEGEATLGRVMEAPRVEQINTRANNSFLPTQQNVEVQRRGSGTPAPSLQLPPTAESVLN